MPYHIGEQGSYGCKGYPVVKDSDGTVMGCHDTKDAAKKQLAALYINEPEIGKSAGFVPPQGVRSNAKRGLELRAKYNRGGTEVGVARARDLSNGAALSLDTLKRMNSFFARHEVDKKGEGWGKDSAGYIAWLLWGGDAGWAWAKRVIREQENKEKSTMTDLTTSYFGIEKADRNSDGTLTVYGKATDDSIDIDQQICDSDWLNRAMPAWFKSGGNIREQHSSIAAGVAKEYESKADGHYISALVVDPVSVKKVETGVLKGFSIGIKNPRVTRDKAASNGRIVDGQIVEVSLVDRPANPNCQLMLAKSAEGEESLIQVEDLIEIVKHPGHGSQAAHAPKKGGGGAAEQHEETRAAAAKQVGEAENEMHAANEKVQGDGETSRTKIQERSADVTQEAQEDISSAKDSLAAAKRAPNDSMYKEQVGNASKKLKNAGDTLVDRGVNDAQKAVGKKLQAVSKTLQDVSSSVGKSVKGDITKKEQDYEGMLEGGERSEPADKDLYNRVKAEAKEKFDVYPSAVANSWVVREYKKRGGKYRAKTKKSLQSDITEMEFDMTTAKELIEVSKSYIAPDLLKFDQKTYDMARTALANLISIEANEMAEGNHNEEMSLAHLLEAVHHLFAWYEGEKAEGEVPEEVIEETIEMSADADKSTMDCKCDGCMKCSKAGGCGDKMCKGHTTDKEADPDETVVSEDEAVVEEAVEETHKCLECGCGVPQDSHGRSDVSTAEMVSPDGAMKSAEVTELEDQELPEETKENSDDDKSADIEAIVEQVVDSATKALKSEIASLVAAKEAAQEKAVGLEAELNIAKSLAVAGGPRRTAKPVGETSNDLLIKAATYKAKAAATTDPTLAKGYKLLADKFIAEADKDLNK